jgi:hypothetical protein
MATKHDDLSEDYALVPVEAWVLMQGLFPIAL